jgi:hypothetical protein
VPPTRISLFQVRAERLSGLGSTPAGPPGPNPTASSACQRQAYYDTSGWMGPLRPSPPPTLPLSQPRPAPASLCRPVLIPTRGPDRGPSQAHAIVVGRRSIQAQKPTRSHRAPTPRTEDRDRPGRPQTRIPRAGIGMDSAGRAIHPGPGGVPGTQGPGDSDIATGPGANFSPCCADRPGPGSRPH